MSRDFRVISNKPSHTNYEQSGVEVGDPVLKSLEPLRPAKKQDFKLATAVYMKVRRLQRKSNRDLTHNSFQGCIFLLSAFKDAVQLRTNFIKRTNDKLTRNLV